MRLSGIVIAQDAGQTIGPCVTSLLAVCDEVVVVDSGSKDGTMATAESLGARVFEQEWLGYGPQKEFAVERTQGEWILWLDADEELDVIAQQSVKSALANPEYDVYEFCRRTSFLGRYLDHVWSGDNVRRLFRRERGCFTSHSVHEGLAYQGAVGRLAGHILHNSFPSIDNALAKSARYASLFAQEQLSRGMRTSLWKLWGLPCAAFVKAYILKRGFLDGVEGLIASRLAMEHTFVKHAKLYELQKNNSQ